MYIKVLLESGHRDDLRIQMIQMINTIQDDDNEDDGDDDRNVRYCCC